MAIILSPDQKIILMSTAFGMSLSTKIIASYVDISTTKVTGSIQLTDLKNQLITEFTGSIIDSPGIDAQRCVKEITIKHSDFGSGQLENDLAICLSSSAGKHVMFNGLIDTYETVEWTEGTGWKKLSASGSQVSIGSKNSDEQKFTNPGTHTWTKPTSFTPTYVYVIAWGAGGGGGGGGNGGSGADRFGGAGGGGGSYEAKMFLASDINSSVTVTIGSGGLGGTGKTASADGGDGGNGGNSSFGTHLIAYGGGGGKGGYSGNPAATPVRGGGGGGSGGAGEHGATSIIGGTGGGAGYSATFVCGNKGSSSAAPNGSAEFGGGAGGYISTGTGSAGASSLHGGAGGGVGGSHLATLSKYIDSTQGGSNISVFAGGGATAGPNGNPGPAISGYPGQAGMYLRGGEGGGGGGSGMNSGQIGGLGGDGGARGGGGGGGGCGMSSGGGRSAAGGYGGHGEVIVITW